MNKTRQIKSGQTFARKRRRSKIESANSRGIKTKSLMRVMSNLVWTSQTLTPKSHTIQSKPNQTKCWLTFGNLLQFLTLNGAKHPWKPGKSFPSPWTKSTQCLQLTPVQIWSLERKNILKESSQDNSKMVNRMGW